MIPTLEELLTEILRQRTLNHAIPLTDEGWAIRIQVADGRLIEVEGVTFDWEHRTCILTTDL